MEDFNNYFLDKLGPFTVISFEIMAFTIDFGFLRKPWAEYIHPCDGATATVNTYEAWRLGFSNCDIDEQ